MCRRACERARRLSLWLRTRHANAIVATLVFLVAGFLAAGDLSLPLPAILASYGLAVPVVLLAPLALSSVVGWGLMSGDEQLERVSSRPIDGMDAALATGAALVACLLALIAAGITGSPSVAAAGRNALGYVGLMLVGRQLVGGRAGTLLPVGVAMLAAVFGGDASGRPRWWVWILAPPDSAFAWAIAWICLALGVAATVARSRLVLASRLARTHGSD